jgi:TPR repeat protein
MAEFTQEKTILSIEQIESKYTMSFDGLEEHHDTIIKIFNSDDIAEEEYNLENDIILLLIGNYYELVKQNQELAVKYYEMSANLDNSSAMVELGNHYLNNSNDELMVKYYQMAVEKGLKEPLSTLGRHYRNKKDYDNMKKYFDMGIELSDPECMYQYGLYYYLYGKDNDLAKKYYTMASEHSHPDALFQLAKFYRFIEKNQEEHDKYLNMAIELNSESAMIYASENEKSYSKKKHFLELAVKLGNKDAMFELGKIIWRKERDKERVKELWEQCADSDNPECAYHLGAFYREIEPNPELSFKYFTISAEQDYDDAVFALGNIHMEKKDYDQAVKLYEKGMKKGHARSIYNLGIYYQTVKNNKSMYLLYYQMASDKGIIEATKKLYLHYKNTEPNEKLKKKYMDILQKYENQMMMKNMMGHSASSVMSLFGMFMD